MGREMERNPGGVDGPAEPVRLSSREAERFWGGADIGSKEWSPLIDGPRIGDPAQKVILQDMVFNPEPAKQGLLLIQPSHLRPILLASFFHDSVGPRSIKVDERREEPS